MSLKLVFVGLIVTCDDSKKVIYNNGYIAIDKEKIIKKGSKANFDRLEEEGYWQDYKCVVLKDGQFLMPGLIDCHVHGPQFPNIGLGLDKPLLEWLDKYTFPLESQFEDVQFASKVYNKVVKRLLHNGTTTACYYGSLHLNGTKELVNSVVKHGQRALVGKVSMNVENSKGYFNNTDTELSDTEEFIKHVYSLQNPLVEPIVTPRFAVSCDNTLLTELAKLAEKYQCKIQSHISENHGEIECVLQCYPNAKSYADVYDSTQLLNNKCIMAHAIHLSDEEMTLLSQRGVSVAHCPASNTRLMSGLCPLKKLIRNNITVGLGTDVSGGDSASILDAMRRAMDVSAHLQLKGDMDAAITWNEAFYLATLGGAKALNLDDKIGSFEVGKEFDALVIEVFKNGSPIDQYAQYNSNQNDHITKQLLQRFIYLGDDRNIIKVYVRGVELLV